MNGVCRQAGSWTALGGLMGRFAVSLAGAHAHCQPSLRRVRLQRDASHPCMKTVNVQRARGRPA